MIRSYGVSATTTLLTLYYPLKRVGEDVDAEEEAAPVDLGRDELLDGMTLVRARRWVVVRAVSADEGGLDGVRDCDCHNGPGNEAEDSYRAEQGNSGSLHD